MNVAGEEGPSWWLLLVASAGGTLGGIILGGGSGLLTARALGMNESVADYGTPFYIAIGGAWFLGLLGCYLALVALHDPKAVPAVVILALLLPGSAAVAGPLASALARVFRTTFGTLVEIAVVLYVLLPMISPVVARLIAAALPWGNRASGHRWG